MVLSRSDLHLYETARNSFFKIAVLNDFNDLKMTYSELYGRSLLNDADGVGEGGDVVISSFVRLPSQRYAEYLRSRRTNLTPTDMFFPNDEPARSIWEHFDLLPLLDAIYEMWGSEYAFTVKGGDLFIARQEGRAPNKDRIPPNDIVCPITLSVFERPVCASDGYTYERDAIERILLSPQPISPMTRAPLLKYVYVNQSMVVRVCEFREGSVSEKRKRSSVTFAPLESPIVHCK
jgi:hypothetical protein